MDLLKQIWRLVATPADAAAVLIGIGATPYIYTRFYLHSGIRIEVVMFCTASGALGVMKAL